MNRYIYARLLVRAVSPLVLLAAWSGPAAAGDAKPAEPTAQQIAAARAALLTPAKAVELTDQLLAANAALAPVPLIPTSAFAALPKFTDPVLSPSGMAFAAEMKVDGKDYLGVYTIDGSKPPEHFEIPDKMDLVRYFWAGEGRVLMSLARTVPWLDDEARQTRLLQIDLAEQKVKILGDPREMGLKGDDVLWVDPEGKSLLLAYQATIYEYPGVYSIDLATNRRTRVVSPQNPIWDWYADRSGVVRYGYGWTDRHHWQMVYRKDAAGKFVVRARGTDKDDDAADGGARPGLRAGGR